MRSFAKYFELEMVFDYFRLLRVSRIPNRRRETRTDSWRAYARESSTLSYRVIYLVINLSAR